VTLSTEHTAFPNKFTLTEQGGGDWERQLQIKDEKYASFGVLLILILSDC
jgi:hypothetical protein